MTTENQTIKKVSYEDELYAACNTLGCIEGAKFELYNGAHRHDARCQECAVKLGWIK